MAYEPCGCPDVETCGLRLVMADVRSAIAGILDHTSLADVTRRQQQMRNKPGKRKNKAATRKDAFLFTTKSY
jgi:DNA-binding IscR family transcriptional regulator